MRPLVPLLVLAAATPALAAPEGILRVGIEGGAAWFNAYPDEALGPAGLLRLRGQITERLIVNVAAVRIRQPIAGGTFESTLVPLTIDLRLDRTPIAPYVGAGAALVRIEGLDRLEVGGVFQAGFEWGFTERLALSAQLTWAGIGAEPDIFPFYSSLTCGLSATVF